VPSWPGASKHRNARNNASVAYQHSAGRLRVHIGANAEFTGENMMHLTAQTKTRASARPRRTRSNSAPAYYLGRPASFWIAVTTRHAGTPDAGRKAA
jgi:hypothetical protein